MRVKTTIEIDYEVPDNMIHGKTLVDFGLNFIQSEVIVNGIKSTLTKRRVVSIDVE